MAVRKLRIQCTDQIGQVGTFTVDQTGKQNSPTFDSLHSLSNWSLQAWNYVFRAEFVASNFPGSPRTSTQF